MSASSNYFGGQQTLNDDPGNGKMCVGNVETANQKFDYPGTIYPFSPTANQTGRPSYAVPLRADVGKRLPTISPTCGLDSDPPAGTLPNTNLCGANPSKVACTTGANGQSCENGGIANGYMTPGSGNTSGCSCRCYGWGGNNCEQAQAGCNTTAWSPSPSASVPSSSPTNPSPAATPSTPADITAPTPSPSAASVAATPSSSSDGDPGLGFASVGGESLAPQWWLFVLNTVGTTFVLVMLANVGL